MKRALMCWLVIGLNVGAWAQAPEAPKAKPGFNLDWAAGLGFAYIDAVILVGSAAVENHLILGQAVAEGRLTVADTVAVTLQAGYNLNYPGTAIDVTEMPLSLQLDRPKFYGLVFGVNVAGDLASWSQWAVHGEAGWQSLHGNDKTWDIALSAASGTAVVNTSMNLFHADLCLVYDGLSDVTLFAGPELFLASGRFTCTEAIGPVGGTTALSGGQELTFNQKNALGIMAGATFDIGDQWQITARGSFFARLALAASFRYIF